MSNGARWTVTNDSMLKELDLSEDAQVEFSDNNKFVKVSVSKLKGDGGVFKMYGDIVKGESDKLITRKGSEGTHIIEYMDDAKAKTTGREYLKLVENKGNQEDNKASNKASYKLNVRCTEQGGWCFALGESGASKKVNISTDGKRDFYLYPDTLTPGASSSVLFGEALYQLNAVSDETLVQRMGEIHADGTPQEDNNVWIKRVGGKFSGSRSDYRVGGYGNRYWGFAGGFNRTGFGDKWIHYKGLMLRHLQSSYASEDYVGSGKIYGRAAGVYSAWLNRESRAYYDLVANIARYNGSYGLTNYAGKRVESDEARLNAYMLSAEAGRRMEKQDGGKNLSVAAGSAVVLLVYARLRLSAVKRAVCRDGQLPQPDGAVRLSGGRGRFGRRQAEYLRQADVQTRVYRHDPPQVQRLCRGGIQTPGRLVGIRLGRGAPQCRKRTAALF